MATYFYSPSGVDGSTPAGWTVRMGTGLIFEMNDAPEGKALRYGRASGNSMHVETFDAPGLISLLDGALELWAEGYPETVSFDYNSGLMALCPVTPPTNGSQFAYGLWLFFEGTSLELVSLSSFGFGFVAGANPPETTPAGTKWRRRWRLTPTIVGGSVTAVNVKVRQWRATSSEPSTWQIDYNHTSGFLTTGYVGVWGFYPHAANLYGLGVGTHGDAAPSSGNTAPSQPGALSPASGSTIAGGVTISWGAATDAEGNALTYSGRYRLNAGSWTGFSAGASLSYVLPGVANGALEFEVWASDGALDGATRPGAYTIQNNVAPPAPVLTSPIFGEVADATAALDCTAIVDPDADPVSYGYRYRLQGAGGWTAVPGGWTVARPRAWNTSALVAGTYEVAPGASDGLVESWGEVVSIEVMHVAPSAESPTIPAVSYFHLLGGGCVRIHGTVYDSPIDQPQGARRWRIVEDGVVVVDEWSITDLFTRDYCFADTDATITVEVADRDDTGNASPLSTPVSFDLATYYEDFSGLVRDSNVALNPDFQHVFLSFYGGPEASWNARRTGGARRGAVLEGYAASNVSTGHGPFQNGGSTLLLNHFPDVGIRHVVTVFRSSTKAVPGEILNSHFGGVVVAWTGSTLSNGSGYIVLVGQDELRLALIGQGGGTNGLIQSLGTATALSAEVGDLEWVRLEVTMTKIFLPNVPFQLNNNVVVLVDIPSLSFGIELFRVSDNALIGSLSYYADPIDNGAFDALFAGEYLPVEGRVGLVYDHHEGYTQFDYVQVSSYATTVAEELAFPELLSPSPLQNVTDSFLVAFMQPDYPEGDLWTKAERFNPDTGLWEVLLASTELAGDTLLPYGEGVRSFSVSAAAWKQSREWDLRIATSLDGVEWTGWVQCGRFIVDRTGETRWTSFDEYPQADVNPVGWVPLWNANIARFYPRHGLPGMVEDGIGLLHKSAGAWGTGLGWLAAGYQRRRQVYGLFRLHTIQSELGIAISVPPSGSVVLPGPGFHFFLSFMEGLLVLRSAYTAVDLVAFRVVLGAPYMVVGEVDYTGPLPTVRGKVWRPGVDDEPEWQLEVVLPALDIRGLGGIFANATGNASGQRQREILNFGVTGLDPLPNDLLEPVGMLQAAIAPCTKLVSFSWTTSGYRYDEVEELRIERRTGAGPWVTALASLDTEGSAEWDAAGLIPAQYEARLVGELDGVEVELALSDAFTLVDNSPPLRPSINFVQEREASIYVEASPFEDPDIPTGDYHLASEWQLFDRITNVLLASSGRQGQRLTNYEFLVVPPANGYLVVVQYWDQCNLSASGRLSSGGTLWSCGTFECPPVVELPTSSLWTCALPEEPPPPEEPPVEPEPPVTPEPPPVMSLTVSPASASIEVGSTVQLTAVARDVGGNVLVGRLVTWASLNSSVAVVSPTGLVTAMASGLVKVFAFCEGVPASSSITVFVPAPPPVEPLQPPTALFSVEEVL